MYRIRGGRLAGTRGCCIFASVKLLLIHNMQKNKKIIFFNKSRKFGTEGPFHTRQGPGCFKRTKN